jgi:hypothetical protein
MAFNLAETSATLTAAVSVAESKQTGLSHEEFLNEWNWCWIAQGKTFLYLNSQSFFFFYYYYFYFYYFESEMTNFRSR